MTTTTLDELAAHGQKMGSLKAVAEMAHCVIKGYSQSGLPEDNYYQQALITRAFCVATFNAYAESVYSSERIAI